MDLDNVIDALGISVGVKLGHLSIRRQTTTGPPAEPDDVRPARSQLLYNLNHLIDLNISAESEITFLLFQNSLVSYLILLVPSASKSFKSILVHRLNKLTLYDGNWVLNELERAHFILFLRGISTGCDVQPTRRPRSMAPLQQRFSARLIYVDCEAPELTPKGLIEINFHL